MHAYKVKIKQTGEEMYFTSLSAIFQKVTPEQAGCNIHTLWNYRVRQLSCYINDKIEINHIEIHANPRQRKLKYKSSV